MSERSEFSSLPGLKSRSEGTRRRRANGGPLSFGYFSFVGTKKSNPPGRAEPADLKDFNF